MHPAETRKIQFMIAGVQKAATTSLIRYLATHPDVCTHPQEEITFFLRDEEYAAGYEKAYKAYFGECPDSSFVMAKNAGIIYLPQAAKRLRDHNPAVQVCIVLRNPVDRAYSAYWWARRRGYENLATFEAALDAEEMRLQEDKFAWRQCAYLGRGLYYEQLGELLRLFRSDRIHIFFYDDLVRDPVALCKRIYGIVGLDSAHVPDISRIHNKASLPRSESLARFFVSDHPAKNLARLIVPGSTISYVKKKILKLNRKEFVPPPMDPATRARLIEFFMPHNRRLSEVIDFDWEVWNK